jgi:hypothetical protein
MRAERIAGQDGESEDEGFRIEQGQAEHLARADQAGVERIAAPEAAGREDEIERTNHLQRQLQSRIGGQRRTEHDDQHRDRDHIAEQARLQQQERPSRARHRAGREQQGVRRAGRGREGE